MSIYTRQQALSPSTCTILVDTTYSGGLKTRIGNNDSAQPIFVGGPGVTQLTGFRIPAGGFLDIDLSIPDAIYGIGNGTTNTVTAAVFRAG